MGGGGDQQREQDRPQGAVSIPAQERIGVFERLLQTPLGEAAAQQPGLGGAVPPGAVAHEGEDGVGLGGVSRAIEAQTQVAQGG
jgi:hypothetical protein